MQLKNRIVLGAAAVLASALSLQAQCVELSFGASVGGGDDVVLPSQALGFAFPFGGATYTDIHISTNGFVYLSNAGTPAPGGALCCTGVAATLVAGSPMIAPYWSDLNMTGGSTVKFNAMGSQAVVTWENAVEFGGTDQFSVQLRLLPSGEIYFAYDGRTQIRTAGDFLVGMSEGGGAALPSPSNFAVTSTSTTTTNFEVFTALGSFDLTGQTLQFVPSGLGYVWIPQACAAANTAYGKGCYDISDSFYQLTVNPAVSSAALSNTAITLVPTGSGYLAIPGGTFVAPTAGATALVLTDDSSVAAPALSAPFNFPGGSTTQFTVCSNGSVWAAAGNSVAYAPDVTTMLANPQAAWYSWHDYNPAAPGSGQVKFEEIGGIAYVTWDGVYNFSGTTAADASTVQFQFDLASGSVVIAYGTVSSSLHTGFITGQPHLVGFSPGGPSNNPGSIDFATQLPAQTFAANVAAMKLSAAPLPISTPTSGSTVVYTTDNIPEFAPGAGVYLGINILSIGQLNPGVDLGFVGAPGCSAYVATLDVIQNMVGVSSTNTVSLPIPAGIPSGVTIYSQSAALIQPNSLPNGQNAFGLTTSNGVATVVGDGSW